MTSEYTAQNIILKDSNGNFLIPYTEKQDILTTEQLAATNSGITSTKVSGYDSHLTNTTVHITSTERSTWNAKQAALSTTQLAAANSGITSTKVSTYDGYATTIAGKAAKATSLAGYGITDAYTKTEVDNKVASVYKYKGSVESVSALPTTGQVTGDVYNVEDTGMNYAWTGTEWDALSTIVDLSPYAKSADLKTVATTGSYNDLTNKPTIPSAVTETTVSGWGFTKNAGTLTGVKMNGAAKTVTNGVVDLGTIITSHQDISGKANTADLATVATSGSYNDLTNKPTIPTVNNATLTIQKNGTNVQTFTANQGTNATANITVPTKVSDLTNDSGFTTNTGTVTGIKMNGASKGTSGVVDLGTVLTSHQDISGKQDKLTAGTNITITGNVISASGGGYEMTYDADTETLIFS